MGGYLPEVQINVGLIHNQKLGRMTVPPIQLMLLSTEVSPSTSR